MKKNVKRKGQPAVTMTATGKTSGTSSVQKKTRDVSQKDPTQPKKKNRKRVAERLAAQEAAQNKTEDEK